MEEHSSYVVKMAVQGEQAASALVRPNLDLVIVRSRNEQWLSFVEIDSSNWSIMFLESINQGAHPVVPELNCGRVKGNEDPWSFWMESKTFSSRRLRLELGEHSRGRGRRHFGRELKPQLRA